MLQIIQHKLHNNCLGSNGINIYMKEIIPEDPNQFQNKTGKGKRKIEKNKTFPLPLSSPTQQSMTPEESEQIKTLNEIIQNSMQRYADIVDNQLRETRNDFENLRPIVSEYLDDFIIIGHTLEGERVVMRYTVTPADLDKLTELCKKVLIQMMIQEQNGN